MIVFDYLGDFLKENICFIIFQKHSLKVSEIHYNRVANFIKNYNFVIFVVVVKIILEPNLKEFVRVMKNHFELRISF